MTPATFLRWAILLAAIASVAGCGGQGAGAAAIVTGRVVQSTTELPVEGATVSLSGGGSALTSADGEFTITARSLGPQTLTAVAPEYEETRISITVQSGTNVLSDPVKLVVVNPDLPPLPPSG